jgi:hypothetical protein
MVPVMESRLFFARVPLFLLCVDNHPLIVFFSAQNTTRH